MEETSRPKFRKPNILRKKAKSPIKIPTLESQTCFIPSKKVSLQEIAKAPQFQHKVLPRKPTILRKGSQRIKLDSYVSEANRLKEIKIVESNIISQDVTVEKTNNNELYQTVTLDCKDLFEESVSQNDEDEVGDDSEPVFEFTLDNILTLMPADDETQIIELSLPVDNSITDDQLFECDYPDCNKSFVNKQKLSKHKARHKKEPSKTINTGMICPAYKPNASDEPRDLCKKQFTTREDLAAHLQEEHTFEDAQHVCTTCKRHFYWGVGLRVHSRFCGQTHRQATLHCPWEGCQRTFMQPCRLKEHIRAHTGDRPYPCMHPNCGWSFRTASKLLRHTSRHTGERRHRCTECGCRFQRAEHLREHTARHLRQQNKRPDVARLPTPPKELYNCSYGGCEEVFNDQKLLDEHVSTVHSLPENAAKTWEYAVLTPMALVQTDWGDTDDPFLLNCDRVLGAAPMKQQDVESASEASEADGGSWRAARTHCTWPLEPRRGHSPQGVSGDNDDGADVAHVEMMEGSESNASTIRSDLFLHGNVLINEESESCCVPSTRQCEDTDSQSENAALLRAAIDADLGLPTIDLMQEELMYSDSAVDESSFQVLLLNDADLSCTLK